MAYGDGGPLSPGSQQRGLKKEVNPMIYGGAASGYSMHGLRRPFGWLIGASQTIDCKIARQNNGLAAVSE